MPLRFHQATFDLTGWPPVLDAAVPGELDKVEAECGRPLPAAVREWLCLAESARWHHELDPRENLLGAFAQAAPRETPCPLMDLGGDGGDGTCYLCLDGSDDPPVLEDNINAYGDFELHRRADRFSTFLFFVAWNDPWWDWSFEAEDVPLDPPQLDFLRDHFQEGPVNEIGGRWLRAFFTEGARLAIWPVPGHSDGTVHWQIRCQTAKLLEETTRRVWEVCGLFDKLFSRRPENQRLLERMRQQALGG
jgi:hypothetical protein